MLVLTRRTGELIHIGDNIILKIISVEDGRVKIGIDAPREIAVDREEIYLRKKQSKEENKNAT